MPLPPLREELALYCGPNLADGQPSWALHDPVRNQFFRIDWLTFEIISRWSMDELQAIADSVNADTTLRPEAADVEAVARFLVENQLGSFSLAFVLLSICSRIVIHSMFGNGFFCKTELIPTE